VDLGTREGVQMLVRESTHPAARFSIDRSMAGRSLPLLESSMGLCWLAFAPPRESAEVLAMLGENAAAWRARLAAVRRAGHALRAPGGRWPHTGSVAVPLRRGRSLLGCVAVIWMARAVSTAEGLRRCLPPLRAAVDAMEAALAPRPG
jgi:IclR family transcriptional regulator, mhp operon transcriptional activator